MVARWAAFVIWAAVAASGAYWASKLLARPQPLPPHTRLVVPAPAAGGDLARVFGADPAPALAAAETAPPPDARFRLIGVVAPRGRPAGGGGVALIAREGQPAKAYRVGATVDGEWVLLGVHARGATLGPRGQPAQVSLELPALPPPSTGIPPGASPARAAGPLPAVPRPALPRPPGAGVVPPPGTQPAPPAEAAAEEAQDSPPPRVAPPPGAPGRAPV
jgi:general secretion pathway protein C